MRVLQFRSQPRLQPSGANAALVAVAMLLIAATAPIATAQVDPLDYESFLAELNDAGAQYVVVSNHFRHTVACSGRGCVLMGPTDDQEGCRQWARSYNALDPLDYARCIESIDFEERRY